MFDLPDYTQPRAKLIATASEDYKGEPLVVTITLVRSRVDFTMYDNETELPSHLPLHGPRRTLAHALQKALFPVVRQALLDAGWQYEVWGCWRVPVAVWSKLLTTTQDGGWK